MRRLTIAVCLLLVPWPTSACYDHEAQKSGWFDDRSFLSRELPRESMEWLRWDQLLGAVVIAAGSATLVLAVVLLRAIFRVSLQRRSSYLEPRTARPLALPVDWPTGLQIQIHQGHERPEPNRIRRENADCSRHVEVAAGREPELDGPDSPHDGLATPGLCDPAGSLAAL
jgi:hypothetical protein